MTVQNVANNSNMEVCLVKGARMVACTNPDPHSVLSSKECAAFDRQKVCFLRIVLLFMLGIRFRESNRRRRSVNSHYVIPAFPHSQWSDFRWFRVTYVSIWETSCRYYAASGVSSQFNVSSTAEQYQ